jgi:hypothetical protein
LVAVLEARDQHLREEWVQVEMTKLIREKLSRCYKREGPNFPEKCSDLIEAYVERLERGGVKSWRQNKSVEEVTSQNH